MNPVDDRGRLVGELLGERYEVLGLLGKGGFASVYQVKNRNLERLEALKVLDESRSAESTFTQRFTQEARTVAALEHPHIIKIHEFGNAGGFLWYTMQFVDGPSLALRLERHGRLHEEEAARIADAILDALDYAHGRGVIHRDIKPANILLDLAGRPILTDFGIAKVGDSLARTQTGFVLGSPGYLSPEQLRGETLDGRADLYSLGITLYEALTGMLPFASDEAVATVVRRLTEEAAPISGKLPGIDPRLERVVMRALARDREARYPSAREMREDLAPLLGRVEPAVSPEDFGQPTGILPVPVVTASTKRTAPLPSEPVAPERARLSRRARITRFAALVAVAAGIGFLLRSTQRSPTVSPETPRVPDRRLAVSPSPTAPSPAPTSPASLPAAAATSPAAPTATRAPARTAAAIRTPTPTPAPPLRRQKDPPDIEGGVLPVLEGDLIVTCAGKKVGISIVVAEDGSLANAKVIDTSGVRACDDVALRAVKRARFKPAIAADGKPVEGRFITSVEFPPPPDRGPGPQ